MTSCLSLSSRVERDVTTQLSHFLKKKAEQLGPHETIVTLVLDEIHVQPSASFKGGGIQGFAANKPLQQATTVQAFMISSVLSRNKDIVALISMSNATANTLKEMATRVLHVLHCAGYRVLCMISDNNRINRNMFAMFCDGDLKPSISHPLDSSLTLFFLFDSVHLLKCIRNNWINTADSKQTLIYPDLNDKTVFHKASFADLKSQYNSEEKRIVKLAPQLTHKALYPSNTERQKVSLALKFCVRKQLLHYNIFQMLVNVLMTQNYSLR